MIEYQSFRIQAIKHYNDIARDVLDGYSEPIFFNSGFVGIDTKVDNYNKNHKRFCLPYVHLIEQYNIETNNRSILEVGCGFGRGCFFLKNKYNFASVTGCDINANVIDIARQLFTKTEFIVADAVNLQAIDRQFDIVVTIETVPYWVNYPDVHESFYSAIKPGGDLIIASDIHRKDTIKLPGFKLVGETDIMKNVLLSLEQDTEEYIKKRIQLFNQQYNFISQHYIRE